ncbi:permease [Dietzia sp. CW19]|uniref:permease n=1 Tax=Dietzia sp. CW19 TaxID=1630634 RepID=UPI0015FE3518|nr:permease [Dietzia sp. CW19]MBB1051057.1 permease [Dietzia sp. CW19]
MDRTGALGDTARGVAAVVVASGLFGGIFYLSGVIDASAEVVFGWRIVVTFACYSLVMLLPSGRVMVRDSWATLTREWWSPLVFGLLCVLVGMQLWLFSWAPLHGHALDASLGFLLLPLALVIGSRAVLKSEVSTWQWMAVGIAAAAVAVNIGVSPSLSWVTFVICTGYPIYFVVRRRVGMDKPMAFGFEVAALTPLGVWLIVSGGQHPSSVAGRLALVSVGVAGAAAMAAYLAASQLLTLPLFGLLGYLEPVLLVAVAFALGETVRGIDTLTFGLLGLALTLLAAEGYRAARRDRRSGAAPRPGSRRATH